MLKVTVSFFFFLPPPTQSYSFLMWHHTSPAWPSPCVETVSISLSLTSDRHQSRFYWEMSSLWSHVSVSLPNALKFFDFFFFWLWSLLLKDGIKICTTDLDKICVTIFQNLQRVAPLRESTLTCWLTAADSRIWNKFKSIAQKQASQIYS